MIDLRTLGTLDLRTRDGPELRSILSQPKRTAILCYLALARPHGFHRRDKLLALFWPETDTEHARASLRQGVRFLRRELGEDVIQSRGDEELALGEGVLDCDAVSFEEALGSGQPERALGLYGGDLLPGFYVEGAPDFERWVEAERTRLRQRAVAGAWAVADARERERDAAGAAEWGRRALALAPTDDAALRRLMQLLDRSGDPDGALTVYHDGVRRLRVEYEIEPSPETIQLGEEICERVRAAAAALRATAADAANAAAHPQLMAAPARQAAPAAASTPGPARPGLPAFLRRWVIPAGLVIAALFLGAAGWQWLHQRRTPSDLNPRLVVVAPFENATGDPSLARLGDVATDWITQGLSESGLVEVADGSDVRALARGAASKAGASPVDPVAIFSRETGAGLVVTGRYYRQADSVAFVARVVNARTGRLLVAVGPIAAATAVPTQGMVELNQRIVAELAVPLHRPGDLPGRAFRPPKYEAYLEFTEGVYRSEVRDEYGEASDNFLRAYALDTTFYHALVAASRATSMIGMTARYDSVQRVLQRVYDRLSPYDRSALEFQKAERAHDQTTAYRILRETVAKGGAAENHVFGLALYAGRLHRFRESLSLMRGMHPDRRLTPRWYWAYLGGAHHVLGDYRGQLRAAAELARRRPESLTPDVMRMQAHAALGHVDEVRRLALSLASSQLRDTLLWHDTRNMEAIGQPPRTSLSMFLVAARELAAHGHQRQARTLVDDGLRWFAARPLAQQPDTICSRWAYAQLLALAGRWQEADQVLAAAPPTYWDAPLPWSRAMVAAHLGNRARALEFSNGLKGPRVVVELGHATVFSALGDRDEVRRHLREVLPGGGFFGEWWLHTEPDLLPYLQEPEFKRLLRVDG